MQLREQNYLKLIIKFIEGDVTLVGQSTHCGQQKQLFSLDAGTMEGNILYCAELYAKERM